jgi:hypothetical protein
LTVKRLLLLLITLALALTLAACGQPHPEGLVFRTADPALSILFLIPQAEVGEAEPDPLPEPCDLVKVNRSADGSLIYHVEGGAYFERVLIDESKGEFFACSEQDAIDAGARRSSR